MPAVNFSIEWPNGEIMECYSPSTVALQYFHSGDTLTIDDLIAVSRTALDLAGKRVEERFGFRCTAADEQKSRILAKAGCFESTQTVQIQAVRKQAT